MLFKMWKTPSRPGLKAKTGCGLKNTFHRIELTDVCYCVLTADAGDSALNALAKDDKVGGIERKSTRAWAMETGHDPQKIFNKVGENTLW